MLKNHFQEDALNNSFGGREASTFTVGYVDCNSGAQSNSYTLTAANEM